MKYLERRLAHASLLLIGVSVLCFLFTDLAPGNYFDEMKLNPQISADTVAALKAQYGMDRPLPVRYLLWLKSVSKGEWGFSMAYNTPVRKLLFTRAANTLVLTSTAVLASWLIALPLGIWFSSRTNRWSQRIFNGGTSLLLAVPELVIALVLLYFVVRTNALPVGGMESLGNESLGLWAKALDLLKHLAVPATTLVLATLPILLRHVRAAMKEALASPFVQAARGHGVTQFRLLYRFALPAAANPLISLFGFSLGGLLSASLLVETVTGWPGLGPFLLDAAISRDMYVVVGVVMASTLFMVLGNFVADVMLMVVDPRIRAS
jgi:peptide/nickel transport system permease protein